MFSYPRFHLRHWTLVLAVLLILTAATATADSLYATFTDGSLAIVDPITGEAHFLGTTELFLASMAYDRDSDLLYAIVDQFDPELAIVDVSNQEATVLGPLLLGGSDDIPLCESIAWNDADGLLYVSLGLDGYDSRSEALALLDPDTREVEVIGYYAGTVDDDGDAMIFIDGQLYTIDDPGSGPSNLYSVDTETVPGQATYIGTFDDPRFNNCNELAYLPGPDRLISFDSNAHLLIDIDWSEGSASEIGLTHELSSEHGGMLGLELGPDHSTAVPETPAVPRFLGNYPNPFNPVTTLRYELPAELAELELRLSIHDLAGRELASFREAAAAAGIHERKWRGCDDRGRELPSGIYLLRLGAGGRIASAKMTLLR